VEGQRLLLSPLGELADRMEQEGFSSPSVVVVGQVVAQRVAACAPAPAPVEMPIPF
jgi:uroporphyrin-III C-methyltransferase